MFTSITPGSGVTCSSQRARRRIAFQHELHAQRVRGQFDRAEQLEIILERGERRHEQVQDAVAHFDAQRGARDPRGRFEALGLATRVACRPAVAGRAVVAPLHHGLRGRLAMHAGQVARRIGRPRSARGSRRHPAARHAARTGRARRDTDSRRGSPTAANRAADDSPSANRRASGTSARRGRTTPLPARAVEAGRSFRTLDRQHIADHAVELLLEHLAQPRAFGSSSRRESNGSTLTGSRRSRHR